MQTTNRKILPVIVMAQFFCTSMWFAGNVILPDLVATSNILASTLGHIIAAVQFGFITGTFVYATLFIADRFPASTVFFCSAVLAALANILMIFFGSNLTGLLLMRFFTGFFLAGIYPVGMKIAADHFEKGLGKALGFLVGALVVGTALPHLFKSFATALPWKMVSYFTSALAFTGGLAMLLLVPSKSSPGKSMSINYRAVFSSFKNSAFLKAAAGYFGHMWELYTFWAFIPFLLLTYKTMHPGMQLDISFISFYVIACGGLACVASGYLSKIFTIKKTAFTALLLSALCCLLSPWAFQLPVIPFISFLIFWGLVVIADSPLFSTMVAQHAVAAVKGTAITFVTCIGFSITIASIELVNYLSLKFDPQYIFMILAIGPIMGLVCMLPLSNKPARSG